LLNGGIDSGIFPAYPRAGQESKEREARDVPGKCRGRGRRQIDGKRQKEELLAAESIGQPAEKNCTEHSSGKIGAARKPDVGIRESKRWAFFQCTGEAACERHFQAVEDPCDAEGNDDERVESSPRQSVEPCRDVGRNR